jgi:hypothetical protein
MSLKLRGIESGALGQSHDRVDRVADVFVRNGQRDRFIDCGMRDHDRFNFAQLHPIASGLYHVIFAPDEQIIATLVQRDPVPGAVKFLLAAGRKWIRNK